MQYKLDRQKHRSCHLPVRDTFTVKIVYKQKGKNNNTSIKQMIQYKHSIKDSAAKPSVEMLTLPNKPTDNILFNQALGEARKK